MTAVSNRPTLLRATRVLTPDEEFSPGCALFRDGSITAVGPAVDDPSAECIELPGLTLVPGFVDVHVHGGGGYSLAASEPEEIAAYARWAPAHGVTAFLATILARTPVDALPLLRAVSEAIGAAAGGAEVLGVNLEGPFVNPARRGALPSTWPVQPDIRLYRRLAEACGGALRLMTVAPELPGALDLVREAAGTGVTVSVGHSDATCEQASAGFEAGARHVTHAFNAMRPFHQREPGIIGAALGHPQATVEVIADGVHLHPGTAALLLHAFGPHRIALITDAVPPAGLPSGVFRLGGEQATLEAGRVSLPDGTIAGSAATMDSVFRNVVAWGFSLTEAVRMASTVPAAAAAAGARKGRLQPGYDADIVALTEDLQVAAAWSRGRQTHGAAAPFDTP